MTISRREILVQKIQDKVPLTLDDRVYYHEARVLYTHGNETIIEPVLQTTQDVKDFFQRHGRDITDDSISKWLDCQNVPE